MSGHTAKPSAPSINGRAPADDNLFHLGYVSTSTYDLPAGELIDLLSTARRNNARHNVTGVLLHKDHSFFQVLEGEERDVRSIFSRIQKDTRHQRIEVLFEEGIENREFSDWRMGFVELDGVDVSQIEGVSDYLSRDLEVREMFAELSRTRRLMMLFRQMT